MVREYAGVGDLFADCHVKLAAPVGQAYNGDDLREVLAGFDGAIIGDDRCNADALRDSSIRVLVKWGVGVDSLELDALRGRRIRAFHTPGVFGDDVAEVAVGYLLSVAHSLVEIDRGVRSGEWRKPMGRRVKGMVVAIVGFGAIGQAVADRVLALGAEVIAVDPQRTSLSERFGNRAVGVHYAQATEAASEADAVVVTAALTPTSRNLVGRDWFANCKAGQILVNVARGGIVDEQELLGGLKAGRVGPVALDVFEIEPVPFTSPLLTFERVVCGSHNASNSREGVYHTNRIAAAILLRELGIGNPMPEMNAQYGRLV
jgi:D-3-phosphoglycerate dehydrogenase